MSDPEFVAWVRQWVSRAEEDLDVARHLLKLAEETPAGAVCFHAQQCVEKYLKGLLAWHGVHFRKIHDLEKLVELLPAGVTLALAPGDLAVLNRYAVEGRYPACPSRPLEGSLIGASVLIAGDTAMIRPLEVEPRDGFRLWLRYEDGVAGTVDLSDLAGRGVFGAWKERRVFEAVRVNESGALEWPGGLDLCGDALYMRLTGKSPEDVFPTLRAARVDA